MDETPLTDAFAAVRARIGNELDVTLGDLAERHEAGVVQARKLGEAIADKRWASRLETLAAQGRAELTAAVAAARAEVEQRVAAEVTRVRIEADRKLAEQTSRWRSGSDQRAAMMPTPDSVHEILLHAFQRIDSATTLSDTLAALVRSAAAQAGSTTLFIVNGSRLDRWPVHCSTGTPAPGLDPAEVPDAVIAGMATGNLTRSDGTRIAAPLLLDGSVVGVLFVVADRAKGSLEDCAQRIESLARFGSAHLGYLTATRTAQARNWISRGYRVRRIGTEGGSSQQDGADRSLSEDDGAQPARRYARLLVSEIKLYNEASVREGRARRDLLQRLGPEVDRARRLYEERVPSTVAGRSAHFHHELVQTLAGGDASLLGKIDQS